MERCLGWEQAKKGHFHLHRFTLKLHCPLAYESHCPRPLLRDGDDMERGSLSELPAHFLGSVCWGSGQRWKR